MSDRGTSVLRAARRAPVHFNLTGMTAGVISLAMLVALGAFLLYYANAPGKPAWAADYEGAKAAVLELLKCPATAAFAPLSAVQGSGKRGDSEIRAWVDSQNSFGALVRQHFTATTRGTTCDVRFDP